jgi:SAM-dependent methyltransferase
MLEFHTDHKRYFELQLENARTAIIPFIAKVKPVMPGMRLLEIGCGQGSLLRAFAEKGCLCTGVEMFPLWIEKAKEWLRPELDSGQVKLLESNIYNVNPGSDFDSLFDIIVLKDVIEHIYDQQKLITWMKSFLKPDGCIFFAFPPWYMPYGGHQQMLSGWLGKTPWWHLLPMPLFRWLMKANRQYSEDLVDIKKTGISIERFQRCLQEAGLEVKGRRHWLINPVYQYKFGWKPKEQFALLAAIPFVRNFFTTCSYYVAGISK